MAEAGRCRLLRVSCRANQWCCTRCVPLPCHKPLAALAPAAQSKGLHDMGAGKQAGCRLPSETAYPSSLAWRSLRRQTPKVRAVCSNPARTDLCGGRQATGVPTAIFDSKHGLDVARDFHAAGTLPDMHRSHASRKWLSCFHFLFPT